MMVSSSRDCRPPPTEESPQSFSTLAIPTVTRWLSSPETAGPNTPTWIFMICQEIVNWKVELFTEVTLYQCFVFRNRFICQAGRRYSRQMFFHSRRDYHQYYRRSVMLGRVWSCYFSYLQVMEGRDWRSTRSSILILEVTGRILAVLSPSSARSPRPVSWPRTSPPSFTPTGSQTRAGWS